MILFSLCITMNYSWLLVVNNVCSFTFIDFQMKKKYKESKFLIIYGISSIFLTILNSLLVSLSSEVYKSLFNFNTASLEEYSNFSKFVLLLAVRCFDVCGIVLLIAQLIRRRLTINFMTAINQFKMLESSTNQLKIKCCINFIFIVIFPTFIMILRDLFIYRFDNIFAFIGWFAAFKVNFIISASFNFYNNFQQFVLTILQEIQIDLQDFEFSNDKLEKSIIKFVKIENFLEHYEKVFGFQQTVANVTCVFAFVTFVS